MSAESSREADFWDARVPDLASCVREVEEGPDPNTAWALDLLAPLEGRTVLDIGCGTGVLSAWIAAAGAHVTGIDISAASIVRARELHRELGYATDFIAGPVARSTVGDETFERLAGRYALHHLDPPAVAEELAALLRPGGTAAFVETLGLNPLLRFSRRHLAGRWGVPSYGSADERPLTTTDLRHLEEAFGVLELHVAELRVLRILDRQVLRYRWSAISRACAAADDALLRLGLDSWSYHQVVFLRRR